MDLSNDNIIHIKKDDIEYLQFRKLLEYGIINCYTLSLYNIDFSRKLDDDILNQNYYKICRSLNISQNTIVRPIQSHTDNIQNVEKFFAFKDVDGLLTNKEDITLMLTFADCTPIFIYDPIKKVIGNIHSGWRGTMQKIGQKAILKMIKDYDSNVKDLIVCIGPCIGKCHFEVSEDVKEKFENNFSYLKRNCDIIEKSKYNDNKYFIDTTLINRLILEEVGVQSKNIIESGICTVCNADYMHSYRANKDKAGRNVGILKI